MDRFERFHDSFDIQYVRATSYLRHKLGNYLPFLTFTITLTALICLASLPPVPQFYSTSSSNSNSTIHPPYHNTTNSNSTNIHVHTNTTSPILVPLKNNYSDFAPTFLLYSALGMIFMYSIMVILRIIRLLRLRMISTTGRRNRQERLTQIVRALTQMRQQHGDNRFIRSRIQLAMMNRDFTGDDYDILRELDEIDPQGVLNQRRRGMEQGEINRLPLRTLTVDDLVDDDDNNMNDSSRSNNNSGSAVDIINDSNADVTAPFSSSTTSHRHMCNICLAPYAVDDVVRTMTCMHQFHRDCIDHWLEEHSTCPVCKFDALMVG